MNWILILLTTCTHHSELQGITALLLTATFYSSLDHPLRLFHPAVSSSDVPWQRLLTAEVLQLPALRSFLRRFSFGIVYQPNCTQLSESESESELLCDCLPAIPSNELDRHLFSASLAEPNCTQLSESQSELLYDWRFTANQFVLATSPVRLKTSIFFN
jgi:hypothetical protein